MGKKEENFYELLGVNRYASMEDIRKAYLNLAKELHPDKIPLESGQYLRKLAEERLKLINEAYTTLKDEKLRVEYDAKLFEYMGNSSENIEILTLDELLSPEILNEGVLLLQEEERKIYLEFICKVDQVETHFKSYLDSVEEHLKRTLSPDTALMRCTRLLRLLGLEIILFVIFYCFLFWGVKLFNIFIGSYMTNTSVAFVSVLISATMSLSYLILESTIDSTSIKNIQDEYIVFSEQVIEYCHKYKIFSSEVKLSKLISVTYKSSYVNAIKSVKRDFDKKLEELTSKRKKIINELSVLEPYHITPQKVINMPFPERFLLVKALEKKYKQEVEKQRWNEALTIAGGIGLLAIIIGTGGGFKF
ncbi:J domain-containing protein [Nostoc sp. FACHB-87]|uniref:J domain-containing protein n=1 Tax=Nostocaceae TaxID=1162 RepID=UPI001683E032|nr:MULTISPECIES: J domain-containing protein [Nostocaceae]MBD2458724.1 J domain-containing protein [Nostoc sp. FACHB-87]MBD2479763.1 J domain-containing protein [Anabaena sp. FACHB-83]